LLFFFFDRLGCCGSLFLVTCVRLIVMVVMVVVMAEEEAFV
jgi:hypothetical protein